MTAAAAAGSVQLSWADVVAHRPTPAALQTLLDELVKAGAEGPLQYAADKQPAESSDGSGTSEDSVPLSEDALDVELGELGWFVSTRTSGRYHVRSRQCEEAQVAQAICRRLPFDTLFEHGRGAVPGCAGRRTLCRDCEKKLPSLGATELKVSMQAI